jgi:hypothetical protein
MPLTASSKVSMIRFPTSTLTGSLGLGEIKIRYLETRRLADGSTAYYYHPPKPARNAGIALPEVLGKDPVAAAAKAEEQNGSTAGLGGRGEPCGFAAALGRHCRVAHNSTGPTTAKRGTHLTTKRSGLHLTSSLLWSRDWGPPLHIIADNYATHKHPQVKKWLERHPASACTSHQPPRHG